MSTSGSSNNDNNNNTETTISLSSSLFSNSTLVPTAILKSIFFQRRRMISSNNNNNNNDNNNTNNAGTGLSLNHRIKTIPYGPIGSELRKYNTNNNNCEYDDEIGKSSAFPTMYNNNNDNNSPNNNTHHINYYYPSSCGTINSQQQQQQQQQQQRNKKKKNWNRKVLSISIVYRFFTGSILLVTILVSMLCIQYTTINNIIPFHDLRRLSSSVSCNHYYYYNNNNYDSDTTTPTNNNNNNNNNGKNNRYQHSSSSFFRTRSQSVASVKKYYPSSISLNTELSTTIISYRPFHHNYYYLNLQPLQRNVDDVPDIGNLTIQSVSILITSDNNSNNNNNNNNTSTTSTTFQRHIPWNDDVLYEKYRNTTLNHWDADDGHSHEKYYGWEDLDFAAQKCERPKWTYELHPNCNFMHEKVTYDRIPSIIPAARQTTTTTTTTTSTSSTSTSYPTTTTSNILSEYNFEYLAHGYYRDSFLFYRNDTTTTTATTTTNRNQGEEFVLKSLRYEHNPDRSNFILIHAEAITYDVLSSSNRIANMYSFCGDSFLLEKGIEIENKIMPYVNKKTKQRGFMDQKDLDQLQLYDVHPMNNLTNEEKLRMIIEITEGIAEQHGYCKGIMMNDDIEIKQWLQRESDGSLFLNDVGNTLFRTYDGIGYCNAWVQYGGDFKSPEEFKGTYVDESADLWPIGNMIYTLLTGLHPYYNITTKKQSDIWNATQTYVPYIDPRYKSSRSFIEKRLVEIMEQCHQHNVTARPSIFDVVRHLHETKLFNDLLKQKQKQQQQQQPQQQNQQQQQQPQQQSQQQQQQQNQQQQQPQQQQQGALSADNMNTNNIPSTTGPTVRTVTNLHQILRDQRAQAMKLNMVVSKHSGSSSTSHGINGGSNTIDLQQLLFDRRRKLMMMMGTPKKN